MFFSDQVHVYFEHYSKSLSQGASHHLFALFKGKLVGINLLSTEVAIDHSLFLLLIIIKLFGEGIEEMGVHEYR